MREIVGAERDALLLDILKRLEEAKPHADAEGWERGWQEALERFRADPREESLVPSFIKPDQPVRCEGGFITGYDELDYVRFMQSWLYKQFEDCEAVYEFGCGTGFNLVRLARKSALFRTLPASFVGYDLSKHAVELTCQAGVQLNLPIAAASFDMREPSRWDQPQYLKPGCGVFTFGAMEQLGEVRPFVEWLIAQKPARVVHVEPIPELLNPGNLIDWLSIRFHEKREYTIGLLPYLQAHPKVEVLHVERSHFGSLMLESYARIVWRPR